MCVILIRTETLKGKYRMSNQRQLEGGNVFNSIENGVNLKQLET
jgi:hypothetical protein